MSPIFTFLSPRFVLVSPIFTPAGLAEAEPPDHRADIGILTKTKFTPQDSSKHSDVSMAGSFKAGRMGPGNASMMKRSESIRR